MTNKEVMDIKFLLVLTLGLVAGIIIGAMVTGSRYDGEIRIDQVELKEDVAKIKGDKATIKDAIDTLLFHAEQLKLERQELRELKLTWSKGEKDVKK